MNVQHSHGMVINLPAWSYDFMVRWLVMRGREQTFRKQVLALAQLQLGDSVLDVGCGTGTLAVVAKERVGKNGYVAGIDPSAPLLNGAKHKAARRKITIDFQVAGIESLPFPDGSFDVVLSTFMMHHLPAELKRQGLTEIARVLKPSGRLVIVDFKRPDDLPKAADGLQELPAYLKAAGFAQIETGDIAFKVRSVAGKKAGHQDTGYIIAKLDPAS